MQATPTVPNESSLTTANINLDDPQGAALAVRELAEIQAEMTAARRFPRNEVAAAASIMKACSRPRFAADAEYRFRRGGGSVHGPSIYFAREAARSWGNITYGVRVIPTQDDQVLIEGWGRDLQTNTTVRLQDRFRPMIQRKDKRTGETRWVEPDERDLRELVNRRGALIVRNALLQLLPSDIIDEAMEQCAKTQEAAAKGDLGDDRERTLRALARAYDRMGVTVDRIEAWLGHPLQEVSPESLAELRGMYKAIKDGAANPRELFAVENSAPDELEQKVLARAAKKAPPEDPEVESERAHAALGVPESTPGPADG